MKTSDMTTGVVYAQARGKYSFKSPVLLIDSRTMTKWRLSAYSYRSATKLCLGKQNFSVDATGPLFVDLNEFMDHDNDGLSFYAWSGPAIEHPAVARALEKTKTFREQVAEIRDDKVREYPYGTWPQGVEVYRPQAILGPWEAVIQEDEENRARRVRHMQAEDDRREAAQGEFQEARNIFGPSPLSAELSYDGRTVTMPLGSFVAIAALVKEGRS